MDEIECFIVRALCNECHLCRVCAGIVEQDYVVALIVGMLLIDGQGFLHQSQGLLRIALGQGICQSLVRDIIGVPVLGLFRQ